MIFDLPILNYVTIYKTVLFIMLIQMYEPDCHRTASVIPLATGDEVIKFLKVKGQGRWWTYALQ